jgi:hypothetical protein
MPKGAMSKSGLVKADHLQIEERFNSLMTNIFSKIVKLKKNINPEPFFKKMFENIEAIKIKLEKLIKVNPKIITHYLV